MNSKQQAYLQKPVNELKASKDFLERAEKMGFGTLEEIIATPRAELTQKDGFNYGWLFELMNLLDKKGLVDLLDE